MTEIDAEILYKLLRDGLPAHARPQEDATGFPAAIEQEIAAGKQVRVNLSVTSELRVDDPFFGGRTTLRKSRGEFLQQQVYDAAEKVSITLEGIELARAAPALMAQRLFRVIEQVDPARSPTLCFSDELTEAGVAGIREFTSAEVADALPGVRALSAALAAIRADLGPVADLQQEV